MTIFILGGVFWNSRTWTLSQFSFLGGYSETENWKVLKCQDLPKFHFWGGGDSETLGLGLYDNFHFLGGGILKLSDLDSMTIFIFGGYSETLGLGLSHNFHLGGYSETLGLGLYDNFHFGGGVFWNSWTWTLSQFSFLGGGGYSETENWKVLKCQDLPKFHFGGVVGRGWGYSETEKS